MESEAAKEKRRKAILEVMKKTGWSHEETILAIEDAKKRTGIYYTEYNEHDFHKVPIDKQGVMFRKILDKKAQKQRKLDKTNYMYVAKVMVETGWSFEYAEEQILEARARTGCTYKEFFGYRFWELDKQTQGELYLTCIAKKVMKKYDVNQEIIDIIMDKKRTNDMFAEYLKREWCVNNEITEEEFTEKFKNSKKIIYKPNAGMQGHGIAVYSVTSDTIKDIYYELSNLPKGVVEEYVIQHPTMSSLNPSSVNTLRIVSISSLTNPVTPDGKYVDIAYACLRIGGGDAIVDNYHSGGMAVAVDLKSGCVVTDGINEQGKIISVHPTTGVRFKGFEIPFFKEALNMVIDACEKNKLGAYIGWDVAITERGPVLIEVNQRPGSMLLTAPWISEKRGMKHVMEKYL